MGEVTLEQVTRFSLPIIVPPATHCTSATEAWYNRATVVSSVPSGLSACQTAPSNSCIYLLNKNVLPSSECSVVCFEVATLQRLYTLQYVFLINCCILWKTAGHGEAVITWNLHINGENFPVGNNL